MKFLRLCFGLRRQHCTKLNVAAVSGGEDPSERILCDRQDTPYDKVYDVAEPSHLPSWRARTRIFSAQVREWDIANIRAQSWPLWVSDVSFRGSAKFCMCSQPGQRITNLQLAFLRLQEPEATFNSRTRGSGWMDSFSLQINRKYCNILKSVGWPLEGYPNRVVKAQYFCIFDPEGFYLRWTIWSQAGLP